MPRVRGLDRSVGLGQLTRRPGATEEIRLKVSLVRRVMAEGPSLSLREGKEKRKLRKKGVRSGRGGQISL